MKPEVVIHSGSMKRRSQACVCAIVVMGLCSLLESAQCQITGTVSSAASVITQTRALNWEGRKTAALATLERWLVSHPRDVWVWRQKMDLLSEAGRAKLQRELRRRARSHPGDWLWPYLLGRVLKDKDMEEAKRWFQAAVEKDPGVPWGYLGLGYCAARHRDWSESLRQYRLAAKLDPDNSVALVGQGDALMGMGKVKAALPFLLKAAARDPGEDALYPRLQHLRLNRAEIGRAARQLQGLDHRHPGGASPALSFTVALLFQQAGRFEEAARAMERHLRVRKEYHQPVPDTLHEHAGDLFLFGRDFHHAWQAYARVRRHQGRVEGKALAAQFLSYPYAFTSSCVTLLIGILLFPLSLMLFFQHYRVAKVYFAPAVFVTGIMLLLQCCVFLSMPALRSTQNLGFAVSGTFRNFLVLAAGLALALKAGAPRWAMARALRRRSSPRRRRLLLRQLATVALSVAAMVFVTLVLTALAQPRESQLVKELNDYLKGTELGVLTNVKGHLLPALSIVTLAAMLEELVCRLLLMTMIAHYLRRFQWRWPAAILAVSVFWAVAHAGMVSPEWFKFTQVLLIGLVLGWLMRKQGIDSCILAHATLNVGAVVYEAVR